MKLNPQSSTPPPISDHEVVHPTETSRLDIYKHYEHPWYKHLRKPNPPTEEAVKKAKFEDKTFDWSKKNKQSRGGK